MAEPLWRSACCGGAFACIHCTWSQWAWWRSAKDLLSGVFLAADDGGLCPYADNAKCRDQKSESFIVLTLPASSGLLIQARWLTCPFVLLLLDYWPFLGWGGTSIRLQIAEFSGISRCCLEKLPFFSWRLFSAWHIPLPTIERRSYSLETLTIPQRLANVLCFVRPIT